MKRYTILLVLATFAAAQNLKDCKTVYIEPMPDRLDNFLAAELVKRGPLAVVVDSDKSDCVLTFGQGRANIAVDSSGSAIVPTHTRVSAEGTGELPRSRLGHKSAAVQLIHRKSSIVVWASSKGNIWITEGVRDLGRKLAKDLAKDYRKAN